jgi:hypothetical protein
MAWHAIRFLYGFLHGIMKAGFGCLVGQVACATIGKVLLKTRVLFPHKLLQFKECDLGEWKKNVIILTFHMHKLYMYP